MQIPYRLGLDIGTNSIGWSVLPLDGDGRLERLGDIIALGARVFPDGRDPASGTSLAVERRDPRQHRRRRDRYLRRRRRFMAALIQHGLMPDSEPERKTLESLDPYELRGRGVVAPLSLHELGRALFHLNQRRGFKSSRKTDRKAKDKDKGKIREGIRQLREQMDAVGAETYGAYLSRRREQCKPVRVRLAGVGKGERYDFYPDRELAEQEFDALWAFQQPHHPEHLTEAARATLRDILLYQRPLKPVKPGRCAFEPEDERAPMALPSAQRFRLLEELNHLRVALPGTSARPLTLEERNRLLAALQRKKTMSFAGIRRTLRLGAAAAFSHESDLRDKLLGDETAALLSKPALFGAAWHALDLQRQDEVVEKLLIENDESVLVAYLRDAAGLSIQQAEAVSDLELPDGYLRLGRTVLGKLVPALEAAVVTYADAVKQAGYHHSQLLTGELRDELPYYGELLERHVGFATGDPNHIPEVRYGRIANPTVHIGLNQLRKLVNALIKRYGRPAQIVVELARDLKQSKKEKERLERLQATHQAQNEQHRARLQELGLPVNGENLKRLRLWEELNPANDLDRHCVFTGQQISISMLFSDAVETEHLLPRSRTLDDSFANKTLCLRRANRAKASQTPYEAFSHSPPGYDWDAILERSAGLPANKRWRFAPDAMQQFAEDGDFLARHLNETRHLSRAAKEYLSAICPPNQVYVTPGRLTALLRREWGFAKSRDDHRHHALDAAIVACTDRATLQAASRAAARCEEQGLNRFIDSLDPPIEHFREKLLSKLERTVVSHKPDHGTEGALMNGTAYGFVSDPGGTGPATVVHRMKVADLKDEKGIAKIRDACIREALLRHVQEHPGTWKEKLNNYSEKTSIRRVRVVERYTVIPIRAEAHGEPYKAYRGDGNYCYEIVRNAGGGWSGEVISTFLANSASYRDFRRDLKRFRSFAFSGDSLVMRLCKNDFVAIEPDDGRRRIMLVVGVSEGNITLGEHFEAGDLRSRHKEAGDAFRYIFKAPSKLPVLRARRVFVDFLGRVKDPGFHP